MKRLRNILFIIILLTLAGYLYVNCFFMIEEGVFGLVRSEQTGDIIRVLDSGYHIIPEGIIPEEISLMTFRKKESRLFDLSIPIPSLEMTKSDFYAITIPVSVQYAVSPERITLITEEWGDDRDYIPHLLKRFMTGYFVREFTPYFSPVYRRVELERDMDEIVQSVSESLTAQGRGIGIEITAFRLSGAVRLPDTEIFFDGLQYLKELMEVEKNNKKELIILRSKLERDEIYNKQFYQKLEEISRLIKQNPDLLKYMYIEKMADKVKVIITPEQSGMPFGLDFGSGEKEKRTGDINNLR